MGFIYDFCFSKLTTLLYQKNMKNKINKYLYSYNQETSAYICEL